MAAATIRWPGRLDWITRVETAWSAVAERLYTADAPPTRNDLKVAGWSAITEHARKDNSFRGRTWGYDSTSTPSFERFWALAAGHVPSPEGAVVERRALGQIWAALPEQHRRVLRALADHGHYAEAADALGVTLGSFYSLVSRARKAFFALWHEHEVPSRPWGNDVRGRKLRRKNVTVIAVRQRTRLRARRPADRPNNSRAKRDIGISDADLLLRHRDGESYESIAASLSIGPTAVRRRVLGLMALAQTS
ncbi:DNA-directed RNA polymerase specialized sigma24 family protein [Nocardiopsis mwathae]|uniref:DNA-directed RNA polymerase specialized sigma24 family protein n=1 Tax=Nocardiopsis mwathae TaxID=1472723 RepID=A0A7W9YL72_9ACTN|nr:hypothetical protein [Nocardiopsis mwathae]MBB6173581.1 DNA-directed RNA polymerase specialized sigma24 family protein [Nocardiopsis mwathae]